MSVAAVVLAAGASTRLGVPKQNAQLGGETLLERTLRIARGAGFEQIFVVVAPDQAFTSDDSINILVNKEATEGMASSIRVGVSAALAERFDGVVILACDQPSITEDHLRELARSKEAVVGSAYAGRKGVPAYFPRSAFSELMALRGDKGARDLLRDAKALALSKGELDIDTADDLKRARELYADDPPL